MLCCVYFHTWQLDRNRNEHYKLVQHNTDIYQLSAGTTVASLFHCKYNLVFLFVYHGFSSQHKLVELPIFLFEGTLRLNIIVYYVMSEISNNNKYEDESFGINLFDIETPENS